MRKILLLLILISGCTSPTGPTNEPPPPIDTSGFRDEVIRLTNDARRNNQPCSNAINRTLRKNSSLHSTAQLHTEDMDRNNYFSHTGRDGSTHIERARRAGYSTTFVGENIARGSRTPEGAMQIWLDSPGHCNNIMDPQFNDIGVGYSNGLWTMLLGRS